VLERTSATALPRIAAHLATEFAQVCS
jgi:hypothetical protein